MKVLPLQMALVTLHECVLHQGHNHPPLHQTFNPESSARRRNLCSKPAAISLPRLAAHAVILAEHQNMPSWLTISTHGLKTTGLDKPNDPSSSCAVTSSSSDSTTSTLNDGSQYIIEHGPVTMVLKWPDHYKLKENSQPCYLHELM